MNVYHDHLNSNGSLQKYSDRHQNTNGSYQSTGNAISPSQVLTNPRVSPSKVAGGRATVGDD